jgi:hypothetical protein
VGGVADAARLVLLHLNDGNLEGVRLLRPGIAAEMRRVTPRGGPLDVGLGGTVPPGAIQASSSTSAAAAGSGTSSAFIPMPDSAWSRGATPPATCDPGRRYGSFVINKVASSVFGPAYGTDGAVPHDGHVLRSVGQCSSTI